MMFGLLDLWCRATVPGYAGPVTRDRLGNLGAGPWADQFREPRPDRAADDAQGRTTQQTQGRLQ